MGFMKFLTALRTVGRKGDAYDKALLMLFLLALGAGGTGPTGPDISQGELDSLLMALAGILATFSGTNVGEHFALKGKVKAEKTEVEVTGE